MVSLASLWLPILLAAVFVFVASSLLHMLLPIHKGDFKKLPGEDAVLDAIREAGPGQGEYMFPFPDSMAEMNTPEMKAKFERGPVGMLVVRANGGPGMGKGLAFWFLYSLLISLFVAYLASMVLPAGTEYMRVWRFTGAAAVLGYAFSSFSDSIWKGVPWSTSLKYVFDGLVYGLVTGGVFGWLWPAVVAG